MRSAPLAALVAALLAAPLGAVPLPVRAPPLLLVARSACGARAALSPAGLERYRAGSARFAGLSGAYRLLGRKETCGEDWETAVTREALAALGAGGGVAAAGRLGARVCAGVMQAARALRSPSPVSCAEPRARGAAVARLALHRGWRRALLAPGGAAPECAAALLEAERALSATGVLVRRAPAAAARAALRPHVIIFCDAAPSAGASEAEVLFLHVAEPAADSSESSSRMLGSDYFKSIPKRFSSRAPFREDEIILDRVSSSRTQIGKIIEENITQMKSADSRGHVSPGPDATGVRVLVLSDEFPATDPAASALYGDLLQAASRHAEAGRTGVELFRNCFFLYKNSVIGGNSIWTRVATLEATAQQSLGEPERWTTTLLEHAPAELGPPAADDGAAADPTPAIAAALCVACALCGALALGAACARKAAARRAPRRPRAVPVLAPVDFQFPADERRRVGEGMETMLSWLQQLHDFGGPEPERPDLLKRPEPAGQSAPSSTCSATRLAADGHTRYKGDPVHMKYLPAATLELRRKTTDVVLVMQSLRHENLNPFIGCLTELRPALVFEACARGSLEDVLVADDIALDWTFRLSLLTDLVRGMRYLHASPVRVHARLSSRNCVVDSRWVLRVTDYGLPALATAQALPYPPRAARDLLWTAPELLREANSAVVPGGTQPGDVFSFAIIVQEVIVRGEPYCMLSLTPEEIVHKLSHPPPLVRPSVSMGAAPPDVVSVMRQCWSEQPELRPDFARLYELFRHMHRGRKTNIVDSMFEMLEKYSNNLEELIKDRTEQLDMEKKKTEQLLNRMLPRSVAERLLLGLRVQPEEFAEVSIYFSDIVGFTGIAARSSPVQVVDLLNDLYTTFDAAIEQYRVYKVETIGDAYMVVGGLPIRCADHAESVATMALHLLHLAGRFRVRHLPATPLHLRIGLHTGACCAGVVGLTMPRYCLFGDTVNTASRMESTGAAWRVQVSGATAERLAAAGGYRLRSRGLTQVKGKGAMHTYWLLGKDGFDKPLPTPPPLESEEVLFEAEGESDSETPSGAGAAPAVERQRSDPSPANDSFAWQKSGAVSAESSPPARALRRCRYLRSSVSVLAGAPDTPRLSDRWASHGARVLRRQWSLERGDALAAAAAEGAPALEPLALLAVAPRTAPPRYRTRRDASALDVSER